MKLVYLRNQIIRAILIGSLLLQPTGLVVASTDTSETDETNHAILIANEFNQTVESLKDNIFIEDEKNKALHHPLDIYSLIHQQVQTEHQLAFVNHKKLVIEVINSNGEVESLFSSQSIKHIPISASKVIQNPSYWKSNSENLYTFQIKYQDQIIHQFSNQINWIAFIGNYLVFMESSQFQKKGNSFVSFIDLKYFKPALAKTALPIFRIPLTAFSGLLNPKAAKKILLNPNTIEVTKDPTKLLLKEANGTNYQLTLETLQYLSKVQQTSFNIMVSLIRIDRYESDFYPFIKDIINKFQKSAEVINNRKFTARDWERTHQPLIELLSKEIQQRTYIGPVKDLSGHYGQLKQTQIELEELNEAAKAITEKDMPLYKQFTESLKQDQAFQELVSQTANEKFRTKKILERLKGLFLYLTKPEPLGAPKIQEALGILASAAYSNKSMSERFTLLKEGMQRITADKKVRLVGTPVLVGTAYFADPTIAEFYHQILSHGANWLHRWVELTQVTFEKGTAFFNMQNLYEKYIANDNYIYLTEGITALLVFTFGLFGSIHILVNAKEFIQHLKNQETQRIKNLPQAMIDFVNQTKQDFAQNLSNMEWRRIGLKTSFTLPGMNKPIHTIFQTSERWSNFLDKYQRTRFNIQIDLLLEQVPVVSLVSISEKERKAQKDTTTTVRLHPIGESSEVRYFNIVGDGDFNLVFDFDKDNNIYYIKDKISMRLSGKKNQEGNGDKFTIQGSLIDSNFTKEEEKLIQATLKQVREEQVQNSFIRTTVAKANKNQNKLISLATSSTLFSTKEVTSLSHALLSLFSYPHWSYTISTLIKSWNKFFLFRNLLWRPSAGLPSLYFANYFNRFAQKNHIPTTLNGGYRTRFQKYKDTLKTFHPNKETAASAKEYLVAVEAFDNHIIKIERDFWRAAMEQGLLIGIQNFIQNKSNAGFGKMIATGTKKNPDEYKKEYFSENQTANIGISTNHLNKKQKFAMELYTRELFYQSMRDFIIGIVPNGEYFSDKQIRNYFLNKIKQGDKINIPVLDMEQIRNRVKRLAKLKQIKQTVNDVINKVFSFKKMLIKKQLKNEYTLNPDANIIMQRYTISKERVKDPENVARVTRYQLAKIIVDKPIELAFLFLILAGVDQGILKILHEETFSNEALFHLSRVAVWSGFTASLVLDLLASPWMKIQMDARLGSQDIFSNIPSKEEVSQKFANFKGFWKEFNNNQNNSLKDNYTFAWKIVIANFSAALVTVALIHSVSLGRFDADLFLNMYLVAILPFMALTFKLENAFESMVNYSLKDLIKKGIDFSKNKHFLAHPDIQLFRIQQSNILRQKFNLLYAVLFNNPLENILNIFSNIHTSYGPRAFQRLWLGGYTLTEYWVSLMNHLEKVGVPSGVTNACKLVFTNKRNDLIIK